MLLKRAKAWKCTNLSLETVWKESTPRIMWNDAQHKASIPSVFISTFWWVMRLWKLRYIGVYNRTYHYLSHEGLAIDPRSITKETAPIFRCHGVLIGRWCCKSSFRDRSWTMYGIGLRVRSSVSFRKSRGDRRDFGFYEQGTTGSYCGHRNQKGRTLHSKGI